MGRDDLEKASLDHACSLPPHPDEVRRRTLDRVDRTTAAVRQRLMTRSGYLAAEPTIRPGAPGSSPDGMTPASPPRAER